MAATAEGFAVKQVATPRSLLDRRLPRTGGDCIVARRRADGGYSSRKSSIPFRAEPNMSSVSLARFAYRGWEANASQPKLMAVCDLPDTPSARLVFESTFGGKARSASELREFAARLRVTDGASWTPGASPHLMQGAGHVRMIDGEAAQSPAVAAGRTGMRLASAALNSSLANECSIAIIPPPECEGWMPEDETKPDVPPGPFPELEIDIAAFEEPLVSVPHCFVSTDFPHWSTTTGFAGNINVKAKTACSVPMYLTVQTTLRRQSCFLWIFCTWPAIAQSVPYTNASAMQVLAPAAATCAWQDGWYRGTGYHMMSYLGQPKIRSSGSWAVRIRCW